VNQRSDLKEEQERLEQELRDLLDEQELKYKEHFVETDRSDNKLHKFLFIEIAKQNKVRLKT
jgi:hypothetical protein